MHGGLLHLRHWLARVQVGVKVRPPLSLVDDFWPVLADEGQQLVDLVSLDLVLGFLGVCQFSPFLAGLTWTALLSCFLEDLGQVPIKETVACDFAAALVIPRFGEFKVALPQLLEIRCFDLLNSVRLPLIIWLIELLTGGPFLAILRQLL